MATTLSEWQTGVDTEIRYPGIISCMTVTCRYGDGNLGGVHLTVNRNPAGDYLDHEAEVRGLVGELPGDGITALYVVGNFSEWTESAEHAGFRDRSRLLTAVAGVLNHRGVVRSFNLNALSRSASGYDLMVVATRDNKLRFSRSSSPRAGKPVATDRFDAANFKRIWHSRFNSVDLSRT